MPHPNKALKYKKTHPSQLPENRLTHHRKPKLPIITNRLLEQLETVGIEYTDDEGVTRRFTVDTFLSEWARQVMKGNYPYFKEMLDRIDGKIESKISMDHNGAPRQLSITYVNDWRGKAGTTEPAGSEQRDSVAVPPPGADIIPLPDEAFQLVDRGETMEEDDRGALDRD